MNFVTQCVEVLNQEVKGEARVNICQRLFDKMPYEMQAQFAEKPALEKRSLSDCRRGEKKQARKDCLDGDESAPKSCTFARKRAEKEMSKILLTFMRVNTNRPEEN